MHLKTVSKRDEKETQLTLSYYEGIKQKHIMRSSRYILPFSGRNSTYLLAFGVESSEIR